MPSKPNTESATRPQAKRKSRKVAKRKKRTTGDADAANESNAGASSKAQQVDVTAVSTKPESASGAAATAEPGNDRTASQAAGTPAPRSGERHRRSSRHADRKRADDTAARTGTGQAENRPVPQGGASTPATQRSEAQTEKNAKNEAKPTQLGGRASDRDASGSSGPQAPGMRGSAAQRGKGRDARRRPDGKRGGEKRHGGAPKSNGPSEDIDDNERDGDDDSDVRDSHRTRGTTSQHASGKSRTMLINVSAGDECRIAIVQDGRLEELFIERASSQSHVGSIYKGTVMNVEPSIQAAFVDFGLQKNGFLHISDVQPQYFPDYDGEPEDVGRKIPRRDRPPIQECFRRGQEVICQVIKEGVGTKGPTLTTYLSIPGRFLVMMPGMARHGVSRKIEDEDTRRQMRDMMNELKLPPDMGFIMRTAGKDENKRDLQRDLNYLQRLWKNVVARVQKLDAPAELYQESDLVTRTIRDLFTAEFDSVIVDDAVAAKKAREFLRLAMPRAKTDVELYADREPLFHRFGIEDEIERINMRTVPLPSGGSIVIDTTEAMVAIDVNSGRFRASGDAEEMAYQLNLEAAEEIARQLRLRDLGGLIVCDFIDMRLDRHKRAVERALRDALKSHRERARILRMSAFGLIEITRQRRGPSMKRHTFYECRHCKGTGLVKMPESVVLDIIRVIQRAAHQDHIQTITVTTSADVAHQILNRKRALLGEIETESKKEIIVRGDTSFVVDQVEYTFLDSRGHPAPLGRAGARAAANGG